jgi:hypothetical protein
MATALRGHVLTVTFGAADEVTVRRMATQSRGHGTRRGHASELVVQSGE